MKRFFIYLLVFSVLSSFASATLIGDLFSPGTPPPVGRIVGTIPWLYVDGNEIFFNESYLNYTINELQNDTDTWWPLQPGGWLYDVGNVLVFNETRLNETIVLLDTDTQKGSGGIYLYNDTTDIYLNETVLNSTIDTRINQNVPDIWVDESGDTMTGNLNMSDNNITDVDTVFAHYYAGRSPVRFLDVDTGEVLAQFSTTNYSGFGDDLGDIVARTITVDRLIINDLLNYSTTEPPDFWNSDNIWIIEDNFTFRFNATLLNSTISVLDTQKNASGPYLYNDSTTIYLNESRINLTVQNITGVREEYINITVVGGTGFGTSTEVAIPTGEILQVAVFPLSSNNNYKFSANGSISGDVVDKDRKTHVGDWIVGHKGVTLINEYINLYITNAQIDEEFMIRIRWRI